VTVIDRRALFQTRMQAAQEWELAVLDRLRSCGWSADRFGQGQLPESQRRLLRRVNTRVRWIPDLIAQRAVSGGSVCMFVDAKSGETYKRSRRHDIETASLHALVDWKRFSGVPCVLVTQDWMVHDVDFVLAFSEDGPHRGNGSGTDFRVWQASTGIDWDTCFPGGGIPEQWKMLA
jgi:hypothetical protein